MDIKILDAKEEKDRLQQNIGIIKMEEGIILREILKLERWLKIELLLVLLAIIAVVGIVVWEVFF